VPYLGLISQATTFFDRSSRDTCPGRMIYARITMGMGRPISVSWYETIGSFGEGVTLLESGEAGKKRERERGEREGERERASGGLWFRKQGTLHKISDRLEQPYYEFRHFPPRNHLLG
jgi:hypothetical protein